jgi:hypothetical protein
MKKLKYFLLLVIPLALGGFLGRYGGLYLSGFNGTVKLDKELKAYDRTSSDFEHSVLSLDGEEFIKRSVNEPESASGKLSEDALAIRGKFGTGGIFIGAWLALVFFLRTAAALSGRKYGIFEPDRALCVSCARCYLYCPIERERLKKLSNGRKKEGT